MSILINPIPVLKRNALNERIEKIVDVIGLENLGLFLNFDESGDYADYYNSRLKFLRNRWPNYAGGPLTHYISNEGEVSSPLVLKPQLEFTGGTEETGSAKKVATKITFDELTHIKNIAMIRLDVMKVGSITSNVKVKVCFDNAGSPGDEVPQFREFYLPGEKDYFPFSASDLPTLNPYLGGAFFVLKHNVPVVSIKDYWIVFEYEDDSSIDGSNYVKAKYGDKTGSAVATHNGTSWSVIENKSINYGLYDDSLNVEEDATVFIMLQSDKIRDYNDASVLFRLGNQLNQKSFNIEHKAGHIEINADSTYYILFNKNIDFSKWGVLAVTFSKWKSIHKMAAYHNGELLIDEADDGTPRDRPYQTGRGSVGMERALLPSIGMGVGYNGRWAGSPFPGKIASVILAKKELNVNQISKVSQLLLGGKKL